MRLWFSFLLIVPVVALIALCLWSPWAMTRAQWVEKTTRELRALDPPPPAISSELGDGRWSTQHYLLFSNDWAGFVCHTIHDSERIGNVAVLRSSTGELYISRHHFCTGLPEASDEKQPKDLAEFLKIYEQHGWTKILGR